MVMNNFKMTKLNRVKIRNILFLTLLGMAVFFSACKKAEQSKVIFLLEEDGKQDLWSMNADGSERQQTTNFKFSVQWPDLSKDGKKIVFSCYDKGFEGIYVINSNGKNLKKINLNVEMVDIPCWSNDGAYIAFMAERNEGIQIADLEGNVIKSVAGDGVNGAYQRWSPTEQKLVLESGRDGNSEVYIINAGDDSDLLRLTTDDQLDEWPNFSQDGKMISWSHGTEGDMHTWVMNVDGSNPRVLTEEVTSGDGFASFSSDGSKVFFTCWSEKKPSIYVVNTDGSGLKKIVNGSHPICMPSKK